MYMFVLFVAAVVLLLISVKITINLYRKQQNIPRASKYTVPMQIDPKSLRLVRESKDLPLACVVTEHDKCPPITKCTHLTETMNLYDETGKFKHGIPPNTRQNEGYCLPVKDEKKFKCNEKTGDPILIKLELFDMYICKCKYPHLVSKNSLLGDCDLITACGEHGQLIPSGAIDYDPLLQGKCECTEGYTDDRNDRIGPFCRKIRYSDKVKSDCFNGTVNESGECFCPDGYILVTKDGPSDVHAQFRNELASGERLCVKSPCSWNAYDPTEQFSFSKKHGDECACDMIESFPIHSEQSILTGHYNACFSLGHKAFKKASDIRYSCCFFGSENQSPKCSFQYVMKAFQGEKDDKEIIEIDVSDVPSKLNFLNVVLRRMGSSGKSNIPDAPVLRNVDPWVYRTPMFSGSPIPSHIDPKYNIIRYKSETFSPDTLHNVQVENCADYYNQPTLTKQYARQSFFPLCLYNGSVEEIKDSIIIGPGFSQHTQYNCLTISNTYTMFGKRRSEQTITKWNAVIRIAELFRNTFNVPKVDRINESVWNQVEFIKPQIHFYDNKAQERIYPYDLKLTT